MKIKASACSFIVFLLSIIFSVLLPDFSFALIQFEDVSLTSGISRWGDSFGASWGDFNNDGWPDLWVGDHCQEPSLYLNNADGTFTEVTDRVKYDSAFEQHGAAWADFDNDGDEDLIQIVGGGLEKGIYPNQLFVNSEGLLQNKAIEYGIDYPLGRGRTPLWFDWNSDGYLDVFVMNINRTDGKNAPSVLFTQFSNFFKNDNELLIETGLSGQFAQLFIPSFRSRPAIVIAGEDYYPDRIYEFDEFRFQDITDRMDFPKTSDVLDVAIADFNNDLQNDFFLATTRWGSPQKDRLLIQTSKGFQDTITTSKLSKSTSCWSVAAADFDNDMDIDLYLVCSGVHCNSPNILYENIGDGKLITVTAAGGAEGSSYGKGDSVATADYNNDGFVDIFVTNGRDSYDEEDGHNQLFKNVGNSNHWIEISLEGVISNRDGIGTVVLASAGGMTQMRAQDGGIHRYSQNLQRIHFGLAKNTLVETLTVKWPSGIKQEINNVHADQIMRITELDFTGSKTSGASPLKVNFTFDRRGHYESALYEWDFNNDGVIDSTAPNPSYTYKKQGIYTVKLKIKGSDGKIYTSVRDDYINVSSKNRN